MKCKIFRSRTSVINKLEDDINSWLEKSKVIVLFTTQTERAIEGREFITITIFYREE